MIELLQLNSNAPVPVRTHRIIGVALSPGTAVRLSSFT